LAFGFAGFGTRLRGMSAIANKAGLYFWRHLADKDERTGWRTDRLGIKVF
jgi:hypothetical protein